MPNVYLVGMMGSGKSVTGKKLAQFLNWGFIDLDDVIEDRNRRTITEIFEGEGETFFRDQESDLLKEISAQQPRVIATGGGSVLRPANVRRMKDTGRIVYLETSVDVLWERVKDRGNRPLLKGLSPLDNLKQIFNVRRPVYESVCDLRITTDGQSAEAVAKAILEKLESEK